MSFDLIILVFQVIWFILFICFSTFIGHMFYTFLKFEYEKKVLDNGNY